MLNRKRSYFYLILLGAAMGILEAVVVVYLRELYYPGGFHFPIRLLPSKLLQTELIREICTLGMLLAAALLAGHTRIQRLSAFIFTFGIWDICYYLGLKIFLHWPESLFTWDILFLIPIIWLGPVFAPLICSGCMIIQALFFERLYQAGKFLRFYWYEIILIILGAALIYISFTIDTGILILSGGYFSRLLTLSNDPAFMKILTSYIPDNFHWEIYGAGITLILIFNILLFWRVYLKNRS